MILIDSDHFSIFANRRDRQHAALAARLDAAQDVIAVPIVVVEEVLRGRLAKLRRSLKPEDWLAPYQQLAESVRFLSHFVVAPWTAGSAQRIVALRQAKVRIGTQDLKIAAIALDHGALLISANLQDFAQIPGLRVESWLR